MDVDSLKKTHQFACLSFLVVLDILLDFADCVLSKTVGYFVFFFPPSLHKGHVRQVPESHNNKGTTLESNPSLKGQ